MWTTHCGESMKRMTTKTEMPKAKLVYLLPKKCCISVLMLFQSRSKVNSYVDFMKCMLAVIDLETLLNNCCVVRAECESVSVWHCYPCHSDKCSKVIDTNLYKAVFSNIYTANCMFNGSLETSKSQSSRSFSSIFCSIVEGLKDEQLIFLNTDNFFSIA